MPVKLCAIARYLRSRAFDFAQDTSGAVLIYVTLALPVLIGGGLLAIDASRLFTLHTFLQKGADSLALAAAAELDRKPTAITRANAAITKLVSNDHRFSDAGHTAIAVSSVRFLSALPASDANAIDAGLVTTDPTIARFVEVTVAPQTLTTLFPASFLGGSNTASTTARAVAGFDAAVCEFTPMFMCNPFEGSGTTIFEAVKDPTVRGRQIVLKKGNSGGQYTPGNWGYLEPVQKPGISEVVKMFAMARPPACFIQSGVRLQPGAAQEPVAKAINTRFDIYEGPFSKNKSDAEYRPARNVRKGNTSNKECQWDPADPEEPLDPKDPEGPLEIDNWRGLPDDTCMASGTCPHMGGRMGDGVWDIDGYKETNNLILPYSNLNPTSRYKVYRDEIDKGLVDTASKGGEVGNPQCYTGGTLNNDELDRRLLYIAAINCVEQSLDPGASGGPYAVEAFVKMFLTRPVDGTKDEIAAELVGVIEPGTVGQSVARDIVQLYR